MFSNRLGFRQGTATRNIHSLVSCLKKDKEALSSGGERSKPQLSTPPLPRHAQAIEASASRALSNCTYGQIGGDVLPLRTFREVRDLPILLDLL